MTQIDDLVNNIFSVFDRFLQIDGDRNYFIPDLDPSQLNLNDCDGGIGKFFKMMINNLNLKRR